MKSRTRLPFMAVLSLGLAIAGVTQLVWGQRDTAHTNQQVVMTEVRGKVIDFDDDGYSDTLIMRERQWLFDSTVRRRRQIPVRILWGADTSATKVVYDTTVLTLPFPEDTKVGTSFYDADHDGYRDIVVSWWWADTSSRSTKDRVLVFRGGAALRAERHLVMSSRSAVPDKDYVIRLDQSDSVAGQRVSHGGLLLRERPTVPASRPKRVVDQGTTDAQPVPALRVYPNPADALLKIALTGVEDLAVLPAEIVIVDRRGSIVRRVTTQLRALSAGTVVDVSQLAQGAYTVVVTVDGSSLAESTCIVQR